MFSSKLNGFWVRSLKQSNIFTPLHANISFLGFENYVHQSLPQYLLIDIKTRQFSTKSMLNNSSIFLRKIVHSECRNKLHCSNNTLKGHFFTPNMKFTTLIKNEKDDNKTKEDDNSSERLNQNTSSLLEIWFYEVSPYGSLNAQLPFNTVVRPLNAQDYPDMNKCIIEMRYDNNKSETKLPDAHQLSQISDLYNINVSFDKDKANMNLSCDLIEGLNVPVSCYLWVPLKFDLSVKVGGNESITVESMESNTIRVEADKGNVNLKKIKSGSISAVSKSGDILSQSTQLGNASMHCGNAGSISADKLQGSSITCSTELGSLTVKSLYADSATFKSVAGDILLGHCHGQICVVSEKSNMFVESLDGDLDLGLQEGSINVHLSRHNKVDIDLNTGDIRLSFPEGAKTNLNLSGPTVSVAENLEVCFDDTDTPYLKEGHIGESGLAQVNARTLSGNIDLSMLDWIQAIKLSFMDTKE